jgi:uncharacterized protein (DUF2267 family)
LPRGERRHVLAHLPADVRRALFPRPYADERASRIRTADQFVASAIASGLRPARMADVIIEEVLGEVRRLVPEEVDDVAAVLPPELRELWSCARIH